MPKVVTLRIRSVSRPSASTPDPHDCWRNVELNDNYAQH